MPIDVSEYGEIDAWRDLDRFDNREVMEQDAHGDKRPESYNKADAADILSQDVHGKEVRDISPYSLSTGGPLEDLFPRLLLLA